MDRRGQILEAAGQILAEGGLAALSVRSVAARAGIGASTLRHYFPSQRALYDEVVSRTFDSQLSDLQIRDQTLPASQRLAQCLEQFLPPTSEQVIQLEGWLALYASAVGPDRTELGSRLLATFAHRARHRVDVWLEALEAEGALRHGDRVLYATILLALVDGLCLELLTPDSTTSLDDARRALAVVIETGVIQPS